MTTEDFWAWAMRLIFSATLTQPVIVHGIVVAKRGQTAVGRVVEAKKAGMVSGVSHLGIKLTSLTLANASNTGSLIRVETLVGGTGADTVGVGVIDKLPDAHGSLIQASVLSTTPGSILLTSFGQVIGWQSARLIAPGCIQFRAPVMPEPFCFENIFHLNVAALAIWVVLT